MMRWRLVRRWTTWRFLSPNNSIQDQYFCCHSISCPALLNRVLPLNSPKYLQPSEPDQNPRVIVTHKHTSSRRPPSSALSLELARSLSIHSSSSGLLKGLRASRWMMRSLKGLWVSEAEVPFRRLDVHCFWMSGGVWGTGLMCNLTNLPVMDVQTEGHSWKCVDWLKKKK